MQVLLLAAVVDCNRSTVRLLGCLAYCEETCLLVSACVCMRLPIFVDVSIVSFGCVTVATLNSKKLFFRLVFLEINVLLQCSTNVFTTDK